jgi:N-carbamoylputrescine amidase
MDSIIVAAASVRNEIGRADLSIENMKRWIGVARDKSADLVLFPELNVSGYIPAPVAREIAEPVPGPSTEQILRIAQEGDVYIAFGIIEEDSGGLFCTHVLVGPDGLVGKQRKIHVPAHEQGTWQAGNAIDVFDIGKAKVGIAVCRDAFFDEYTRTLYFKGAEVVLMPFTYYNVPRAEYLAGTIHGMSIRKACWTNGYYAVVCNSAENRGPSKWEPNGRRFPGWAGVIDPWGSVVTFVNEAGNSESIVVERLEVETLVDRRRHPNFLAEELRTELYDFGARIGD